MNKKALFLGLLSLLYTVQATPMVNQFEIDRGITIEIMTGFFSGFIGENITDMGNCGVLGYEMVITTGSIFERLFSGKIETYMQALLDTVRLITEIPQEVRNCVAIKNGFDKLR